MKCNGWKIIDSWIEQSIFGGFGRGKDFAIRPPKWVDARVSLKFGGTWVNGKEGRTEKQGKGAKVVDD